MGEGKPLLPDTVAVVFLGNVRLVIEAGSSVTDGNLDCSTVSTIGTVFNNWLGDVSIFVVTLCLVETSLIKVSGGVGVLGLTILTDDFDCSCETIIVGFGVDTSMRLMTSLFERSTELACVDRMLTFMESMD